MRIIVALLVLANLALFLYTRLDSLGTGEGVRLAQQVQPDKIVLLSPQQVAALGPAKVSSRVQAIARTAFVVRDPPAPAVARMKELQGAFPGSEIKIGTCEKTA